MDRNQARSMVIATSGIVASEHPLASQAGAMVLARGGHAVDAAIAANAVMGVVAPMMNGIGGDLFAIVYDAASGTLHGINGSGYAPAALTSERLEARGVDEMPQDGIDSVTIPGAVAAWSHLMQRFGRCSLAEVLAPAIDAAANGFPVAEINAAMWSAAAGFLRQNAEAARVYLPNGRPMGVGQLFRNPDLAASYRAIARDGRDAFYRGDTAQKLVAGSQRLGGTMTAADLSEYDAEWVTPLSTTYRGWSVYELPPNGQGIAALVMLNLLEQAPMSAYGHNSSDALHTIIEAKKLAYADLAHYVADPAFARVPVAALLSKDYAAFRARQIDPARAQSGVAAGELAAEGGDTTYLTTVDRDGNMVSLIQSNYSGFGSGVVAEGTGFALQNRGALFTLDPRHPNVLAPRKRPLHTIIPAFMQRDNVSIGFGIMGGWNQAQAHAQFVSNVVDHGMNIQAALEAPRVTKLTFAGRDVMVESRIPAAVRLGLTHRGHDIELLGAYANFVGGGQAVMRDSTTGVNFGASDPRKDGAAIPEPAAVSVRGLT